MDRSGAIRFNRVNLFLSHRAACCAVQAAFYEQCRHRRNFPLERIFRPATAETGTRHGSDHLPRCGIEQRQHRGRVAAGRLDPQAPGLDDELRSGDLHRIDGLSPTFAVGGHFGG
jgi:hypothetical protein